ncbi:MAG: FAD-dependent oxidoreductase [Cyanobacteriota bacterium]|nr:FAD-dependent oxidoreductase [Cyanobacteriota bacterium]
MIVVGGGIIGRTAAWQLQQRGHQVSLIDPDLSCGDPSAGSPAALGVLMAQVFHRSSGRAWRLRQRSLALWQQWITQLQDLGHPVELRRGLLLLASSPEEHARLQALAEQRQAMGLPFELWPPERLADLQPALPQAHGALWSGADGQIAPLPLLHALRRELERLGADLLQRAAIGLEALAQGRWQVNLDDGTSLTSSCVVICAGAGSAPLLRSIGLAVPLEPVLGQALELASAPEAPAWSWSPEWPAAAVWQGINLVPRPNGQLWLGATLEPGVHADATALEAMASLNGHAPDWLQRSQRLRQWQGLRLRPAGRPAPWLEQLAPGLLLAGGHYRNGLLLAPATAEWISAQIETG